MRLSGRYPIDAPADRVWALLNDPDVIAACLPGCDRLEPIGDDRFRASLSLSVAAIGGSYAGTVAIVDRAERAYRLLVDGAGKAGFVKGEAAVSLEAAPALPADAAPGAQAPHTVVHVSGDGQVGGLMARVGQRLIASVSQMMMDRFFAALRAKAEAR